MTLLQAVDSAYPTPPPAGTSIVLGYLGRGGETPHTWTIAEVEAAAAHHWFGPIWCPAQGSPLFSGAVEAYAFLDALAAYGVPKGVAVFLDVEHNTWFTVNEQGEEIPRPGAIDQVNEWAGTMSFYGYVPYAYGREWMARWPLPAGQVPVPAPSELSPGTMAWQYAGEISNDPDPAYDLSIADESVPWWGKPPPVNPPLNPTEEIMLFVLTEGADVGDPDHTVKAGQHYVLSGGYRVLVLDVDVEMYTARLGAPTPISTAGCWRWQHD
jgi:hypothetical protein